MYKVTCDNTVLLNSSYASLQFISAEVVLEANKCGTFTFTIAPDHPFKAAIVLRRSIITVYKDETIIFKGTPVSSSVDFFGQQTFSCEGILTFLNDSIMRPMRHEGRTVMSLLNWYLSEHNQQVEERKRFVLGQVTVHDPNNSIYCFSNYESAMECIQADLVDDYGGFLRIRYENGKNYLDYLAGPPRTSQQSISIGKNLLDLTQNFDATDIATVCIPLGEKLEEQKIKGLDARLDITSVNDGLDYLTNESAQNIYGTITKVVVFDNVTTATALKHKGEQWLTDSQFETMVIDASAVDLSLTGEFFDDIQLLDTVRVRSPQHGLNRAFLVSKLTYNLNDPSQNRITLGMSTKFSLSAQASKLESDVNGMNTQGGGGQRYKRFDEISGATALDVSDVWDDASEFLCYVYLDDEDVTGNDIVYVPIVVKKTDELRTDIGGYYYDASYNASIAVRIDPTAHTLALPAGWNSVTWGGTKHTVGKLTAEVYYK